MFSRFFGKRDKSQDPPTKEAQGARGQEVVEDDPNSSWSTWDKRLASQETATPPTASAVAPASPMPDKPLMSPPATVVAAHDEQQLDFVLPTASMDLQWVPMDERKKTALDTVELHHKRIANTIRTLWGYKECGVYINKLIMAGGDGMGHARVGFNQEAVEAMLALSDLHDAEFGPPDSVPGGFGLSI